MRVAHIIALSPAGEAKLVSGPAGSEEIRKKFQESEPPRGGSIQYWESDGRTGRMISKECRKPKVAKETK